MDLPFKTGEFITWLESGSGFRIVNTERVAPFGKFSKFTAYWSGSTALAPSAIVIAVLATVELSLRTQRIIYIAKSSITKPSTKVFTANLVTGGCCAGIVSQRSWMRSSCIRGGGIGCGIGWEGPALKIGLQAEYLTETNGVIDRKNVGQLSRILPVAVVESVEWLLEAIGSKRHETCWKAILLLRRKLSRRWKLLLKRIRPRILGPGCREPHGQVNQLRDHCLKD